MNDTTSTNTTAAPVDQLSNISREDFSRIYQMGFERGANDILSSVKNKETSILGRTDLEKLYEGARLDVLAETKGNFELLGYHLDNALKRTRTGQHITSIPLVLMTVLAMQLNLLILLIPFTIISVGCWFFLRFLLGLVFPDFLDSFFRGI